MITIDRLALRMTGPQSLAGKELGRRIAELLSAAGLEPGSEAAIGGLRMQVAARPHGSADELAGRITDEIVRRLKRSI
ncbi:MAG: hypothetical protein IT165_32430 [Bryobacterales bacterium]|nr:hypothetical protein [Bryobacterales bacterium]